MSLDRIPRRDPVERLPQPVEGEPGLFVVDATWGTIQPMSLHPDIETVGELDVLEAIRTGRALIDTRLAKYVEHGTIPTAHAIPHEEIAGRRDEIGDPAILFCNGPQCTATPKAIEALLDAGHPPRSLRYYRGGVRDWVTLGLPLPQPR